MSIKRIVQFGAVSAIVSSLFGVQSLSGGQNSKSFDVMETTIQDVQSAYKAGRLTAHQLVQMYLDRIKAYDQQGPKLNSIITINPKALEEADRLDAAFKASGPVGPLHGIPVLLKDQVDVAGLGLYEGNQVFCNRWRPGGVVAAGAARFLPGYGLENLLRAGNEAVPGR